MLSLTLYVQSGTNTEMVQQPQHVDASDETMLCYTAEC